MHEYFRAGCSDGELLRVCYPHGLGGTSRAVATRAAPGAIIDNPFTLARHFSRLVALLARQGESVDGQKATLRAFVLVSKSVSARLSSEGGHLMANSLAVPRAFEGVDDLASRMALHQIDEIVIDAGAAPAEVLALARLIATQVDSTSDAADLAQKLAGLRHETVRLRLAASTVSAPARTGGPVRAAEAVSRTPDERIAFMLENLAAAASPEAVTLVVAEVAGVAEHAIREGRTLDATAMFGALMEREAAEADREVRRAVRAGLRRLTTPSVLRPIARLLLGDPAAAELAERILQRLGHDGVDATVDLFVAARTAAERTTCRTVLARMPSAVESLILMLDDERWYTVRQAVELLGQLRVPEAAQPLAELLRHPEERVRRSATRALGRLDVPLALEAVGRSLADPEPPVRLEGAATLASRKSDRAAELLAGALDGEIDIEVQHALIAGLGRVATAQAVDALAAMAAATGGLFTQKKNTSLRVAAIFALGETRTPAAFTALKALTNDREKEVRDAVSRALNAPRISAA